MLKKDFYPLTNPQQNIWNTELYFPNSSINNVGGYVYIKEKVNLSLLKQAINLYVQKNESMRIQVIEKKDKVLQYIQSYSQFDLDTEILSNEEELEINSKNFVRTPFNMIDSPLFSFKLFSLPTGVGGFYVVLHHLISDAWSMGLLISEVVKIYSILLKENSTDEIEYPSYIEYIKTENEYMEGSRFSKDQEFWNNEFSKQPEPTYISKKSMASTEAKRERFILPNKLNEKLINFCKENKVSTYTFFMAIYSLYLSKINNISTPILGTPVLNRSGVVQKRTLGMFISTIPFKINISKDISFGNFLQEVASTQMSIFRHQKYPYSQITNSIKNKYNITENLFDLVLSYQNARTENLSSDVPYYSKWIENGHILDSLEIHFYDMNNTGNSEILYDYQIDKFTKEDIETIHSRIVRIVKTVIDNPEIELHKIKIVNKQEEKIILKDFNNTKLAYDKSKSLLDIWDEVVKNNSLKIALTYKSQDLTYKELNDKANQLANYLVSLKLPKGSIVGIMLNKSIETIVSMLAVLKANMSYMLIDCGLPEERIGFMLKNTHSPLLITSIAVPYIEAVNKLYIEDFNYFKYATTIQPIQSNETPILSVIYTSGSTGVPKGILVKKTSMINLVNGYRKTMKTDSLKNFLSICSVAFDMFAAEVWIPLLFAKKLILAGEEESKNPIRMCNLIKKQKCEFMLITPSKLSLLLSHEESASCLKYIKAFQLGGEVLSPNFYNNLVKYTDGKIYNGYGPSETTSCCSCKLITSKDDINIGTPLPNVQIYICNKDLNLMPIGEVGELCIAGDGVTYGYVDKSLSDKTFIPNPFGKGLLYKSGDLAKWTKDGEIEYVGRNDFQIKIRGLRVELEGINNAILSIDGIQNSCTIIRKINDNDCICSFVVTNAVSESKIKLELQKKVPYYMVPSHIVIVEELPLTVNGKIDTKKLPELVVNEKYVAPKTKIEKKVANIFKQFLKTDKISITSDFFELGGNSLTAIKIITQINYDLKINLSVRDLFKYPNIQDFSVHINTLEHNSKSQLTMKKTPIMELYPTTSAQKRVYYSVQTNKKMLAYNTPGGIMLDGKISIRLLEKCIKTLIHRHSSLRTYFVLDNDDVKQRIMKNLKFSLTVIKGSNSELDEIISSFLKPFDLNIPPLFRIQLIKLENDKNLLLLDFHHIICDGASISLFVQQLCELYNKNSLIKRNFSYVDFSMLEKEYFESDIFDKDKKYWLSQFEGDIPTLDMPTSYTRPSTTSYAGNHLTYDFQNAETLYSLCKKLNTTPFMFLLTSYYILLYKYTAQNDIIVGTPTSGRNIPYTSDIIGMFVNTLALRNNIDENLTFNELLQNISNNCLDSFEHQQYPFDKIVEDLNIKRDTSHNPLFDTMFVYQNEDMPEIRFRNVTASYFIPENHTSKFDFLLEIIPREDYLKINLEYCTQLFSKEFMTEFLTHYSNIVENVIQNQNIQIADLKILSKEKEFSILNTYSRNTLEYPKGKSIIELFENQVEKTPNSIAIMYNGNKLTYKELKDKVDSFSTYLFKNGITKGMIVGTLLNRSTNLIIAMLSIMKCGAVYLPILKAFPEERISYILENSKAHTLIVDSKTLETPYKIHTIKMENTHLKTKPIDISVDFAPDDPLYCIYTSGSTGKPKGVVVTNKNLNNFIHSFNNLYDNSVSEKNIGISTTNICFDVNIWEFFFNLLNGSCLYLYPSDTIENILDFCNTIINEKITMAYLPPNILNEIYTVLNNSKSKIHLNKILLGVEPIKTSIVSKFFDLNKNMKIVNGYGPTETTICSTAFVVTKANCELYKTLPIGKPLHNLNAYILDNNLLPVPIGVPGTLYITGDNITQGYLGNKKLTNEKYLPCPFEENKIMYSTGDIVKMLPNNNIIFVGRNDDQIKIKGHRIELTGISNTILEYPAIDKCIVDIKEEKDNKILIAYFTANTKIVLNDLRSFLSLKLPFYAIPNHFVQLDSFPLTINGKIDKKELKKLKVEIVKHYEPPHTDFEKKLVKLWKKFLHVDKIGINDNFFDLGGDSLVAIRMQIDAFNLGLNISYADIFKYQTIKQLSEYVSISNSSNKDIKNFNYDKIDSVLEKNTFPLENRYKKTNHKNILLTGVTGYVGIHILERLITETKSNIYCIVRSRKDVSYINRVFKNLNFYFGNKYYHLVGSRINIIEGDISLKRFGLNELDYISLGEKITCVINSAAVVKHYGKTEKFDKTNIGGVQNLIDFCENFDAYLYQISTLSVSGNVFADDNFKGANVDITEEKVNFDETCLYVNQDIANIYVYTKFMAERLILNSIANSKLHACIIRLGNITNRYSDGMFQINVSENAFLNRILSFIKLGCIPDYLLEGYGEFTPVDFVADAVVKLVKINNPYTVLHLYNNNHIPMTKLISLLQDYGLDMKVVSESEFLKVVDSVIDSDKGALTGIINDFDKNKKIIYDSNVTFSNKFTNDFLNKLSFDWCSIGKTYIFKYLDYLKGLGLI